MSNPSFENIDQWLFEYMEGNLSPNQVTQLETFILNNPEFDPDMDAWQLAKVDATPVVFPGKVGRQRKPIPFWVSATVVLSLVFAAGGLFGAYMSSADSLGIDSTSAIATSAANRIDYRLHRTNYSQQSANQTIDETLNQLTSHSAVNEEVSNSNFTEYNTSNTTSANNRNFGGQSFENNQTLNPSVSKIRKSIKSQGDNEKSLLVKRNDSDNKMKDNVKVVPSLKNEVIKERKASESNSNKDELAENVNRSSSESTKSQDGKAKKINIERSNTADAMTRGENRISSNYNQTFSKKFKSAMRKIARMTENPIALTNSKDIYYHAPGMQTLNVNAATAGNLLKPRIQSITRAQWIGHSNQQLMNELSFDTYVKNIRGGIGVQVNHAYYNEGTYNVGQIALTYSPKLTVNRNFSIEPAIRFKMGDKRLNTLKLVPGQLIEMDRGNEKIFMNETPDNLVKDLWYKDLALAVNTNTKWFSAGFQVDNLGRHNSNAYNYSEGNIRSGMHYTANLGTDFVSRSKIISFSPYLMYQKVENLSEIWGGSIFRYNNLTVGGAFSSTGDYAGSIGLKTDLFMITYNADMTKSFLKDSRLFSHQVTMRILMNQGYYGRTTLKQ